MKTTISKTMFAFFSAALLSVTVLLSSQSQTAVLAFEKVQGQDKTGKNCERVDTPESSTFGKCENVCKDKEVTRDAENNRWVCQASKAVVSRPIVGRAPIGGKIEQVSPTPPVKPQMVGATKSGKSKK